MPVDPMVVALSKIGQGGGGGGGGEGDGEGGGDAGDGATTEAGPGPDPERTVAGLRELSAAVFQDKDRKRAAGRFGAIQRVVQAMQEHPDHVEVQFWSCKVLRSLLLKSPENLELAQLSGVGAHLVGTVQRFVGTEKPVTHEAVYTLALVCSTHRGTGQQCLDAGAIEAAAAVREAYSVEEHQELHSAAIFLGGKLELLAEELLAQQREREVAAAAAEAAEAGAEEAADQPNAKSASWTGADMRPTAAGDAGTSSEQAAQDGPVDETKEQVAPHAEPNR